MFVTDKVNCVSFFYQSDDCTVFFFTVGDTYKPIGFIETASPVVSIEWSKDRKVKKKKHLLLNVIFLRKFYVKWDLFTKNSDQVILLFPP